MLTIQSEKQRVLYTGATKDIKNPELLKFIALNFSEFDDILTNKEIFQKKKNYFWTNVAKRTYKNHRIF